MSDSVSSAIAQVPLDGYILGPDRRPLPQTSSTDVIASVLRLLDVRPGARVLEVGTGSVYRLQSAAEFGILIGEREYRRKSYGTEATRLVLDVDR